MSVEEGDGRRGKEEGEGRGCILHLMGDDEVVMRST